MILNQWLCMYAAGNNTSLALHFPILAVGVVNIILSVNKLNHGYTYWIDKKWKCFIWKYPGMDPVYYYFDEPLGVEILNNGVFYN